MQHHSVLRTTLTVHPPSQSHAAQHPANPRLSVNLLRGSFFTVLPGAGADVSVPEWHAGNIYELGSAVPNAVDLPSAPSLDRPTTYELVVSGDYEARAVPCVEAPQNDSDIVYRSGFLVTLATAAAPSLNYQSPFRLVWKTPHMPLYPSNVLKTTMSYVTLWTAGHSVMLLESASVVRTAGGL